MKNLLLTIFSIIFCLVSSIGNSNDLICEYTNFTCEEVEYSTLTKRDQIYYKKFSNIPFTGFVKGKCCEKKITGYKAYYSKKNVEYKIIQGKIIQGKREGVWLKFNENGSLQTKQTYKLGILNGAYFDSSGIYSSLKGEYKNNKKHGLWVSSFFTNESFNLKENYSEGKLNGVSEKHYENGNLVYKKTYTNGILNDGELIEYYKNGKISLKKNIKDGKLNGVYENFYSDGKLSLKRNYINGKLHGDSLKYYQNNILQSKKTYTNGIINDGEWIEYHENGNIYFKENYKKGKLDGLSRIFYEDGKIKIIQYYKKGLPHGTFKSFENDGTPSLFFNYKNGKHHGVSEWFYPDGSLRAKRIYKDGKTISYKEYKSDKYSFY